MLAYEKELRKEYTGKSLRALEERAVRLALTDIAIELGLNGLILVKHKFGLGQLKSLVKTAIREQNALLLKAEKRVKTLQTERDNDHQLILSFIEEMRSKSKDGKNRNECC